jgi:hypothetical protein
MSFSFLAAFFSSSFSFSFHSPIPTFFFPLGAMGSLRMRGRSCADVCTTVDWVKRDFRYLGLQMLAIGSLHGARV